jgi:hypothetical protein
VADPRSAHDGHDLERIAALADDRTLDAEARAAAVADCSACAELLDDLRLLSSANVELVVPARIRDFRLDPADAARLTAVVAEPELATDRLGWEMTTPAPDHATHDPELVAAHLDGRLDGTDLARVGGWLAACGACAALHKDLEDLVVATRALPTPTRPRDFTLSAEDARRARSGRWHRLVAAIGSPRDTFTRPLAVGLTTLGIAGLVVANVPSMLSFGSATGAAPQLEMVQPSAAPAFNENAAAPATTGETDVTGGEPAPVDTSVDGAAAPSDASGATTTKSTDPNERDASDARVAQVLDDGTEPNWLVLVSGSLLVVGLILAMLRWRARRLGDG